MITAGLHHQAWRELPAGTLDEILDGGTCLILAPHQDDESLGCGGLIAQMVRLGRPPLVAFLTDGTGSHPASRAYPPERLRSVREQEATQACHRLGLDEKRLVFLRERDTAAPHEGQRFDALAGMMAERMRAEPGCRTILAPWRDDPHCDHVAASLLAAAMGVRHVAYPVWGWTLPPTAPVTTPIMPGWRLDVRADLPAKRLAIRCHASQMGEVITDDPGGFALPANLLEVFEQPFETYLLA